LTLAEVQQAGSAPLIDLESEASCFKAKDGAILCDALFTSGDTPSTRPHPQGVTFFVYPNEAQAQQAFAKLVGQRLDPPTYQREPGDPKPAKPKVVTRSDNRITVTNGDTSAETDGRFGNIIVSVGCRTFTPPAKKAARAKARKAIVKCANSVFNAQAQKLGVG
jgi:hypothetical protein